MTFDIYKPHAAALTLMADGTSLSRTEEGDYATPDGTIVRGRTIAIMERKHWVSIRGGKVRILKAGRDFLEARQAPQSRAA